MTYLIVIFGVIALALLAWHYWGRVLEMRDWVVGYAGDIAAKSAERKKVRRERIRDFASCGGHPIEYWPAGFWVPLVVLVITVLVSALIIMSGI